VDYHRAVACTMTSLAGMPMLLGDCPLSESGPLQSTNVVLKPCLIVVVKKGVTFAFYCVVGEDNAFGGLAILFDFWHNVLRGLCFFGWTSSCIKGLLASCHFWGASFFIGGLFEPLSVLRGAAFFIEGFFVPLSVFRGASVFIGGLFEPMSEGLIARLYSWLRYLVQWHLSNAELTLLVILTMNSHSFGQRSFYYCFGIHSLHLIKNLTPL
jgi:hypothetical protein